MVRPFKINVTPPNLINNRKKTHYHYSFEIPNPITPQQFHASLLGNRRHSSLVAKYTVPFRVLSAGFQIGPSLVLRLYNCLGRTFLKFCSLPRLSGTWSDRETAHTFFPSRPFLVLTFSASLPLPNLQHGLLLRRYF